MSSTGGLPFVKISATGNDFIFIDLTEKNLGAWTKLSRADLVRRIAHRRCGVGSDGVVFVENSSQGVPYAWDFYNDDGSHAEMCGNATRAMGRWALGKFALDSVRFLTVRGPVEVTRENDMFSSRLEFVRFEQKALSANDKHKAILIDTGVPHAVIEVNDIEAIRETDSAIAAFRFHSDSGPRGANVTFLQRRGAASFQTKSFERGIEGFTLSCGTGVLAAAAVGMGIRQDRPPAEAITAKIEAPGGKLQVRFEKHLTAVILTGPAQLICTGIIDEGMLR